MARAPAKLTKLRKLIALLPETREIETWDHPTFRVGEKIFATWGEADGNSLISVKQTKADQSILIQDPRFEVAPYVGRHGWVTLRADQVEWPMIEDLVVSSYRQVAPKRLQRALDDD